MIEGREAGEARRAQVGHAHLARPVLALVLAAPAEVEVGDAPLAPVPDRRPEDGLVRAVDLVLAQARAAPEVGRVVVRREDPRGDREAVRIAGAKQEEVAGGLEVGDQRPDPVDAVGRDERLAAEDLDEKRIALVPTIVAYLLSQ